MRRLLVFSLATFFGAVILAAILVWPPTTAMSQSASAPPFADDGVVSFRVQFGLTDSEPRDWDGTLSIKGGEVLRLRDWHPRPEHQITGVTGWKMATYQGNNFRNRPWEPEPYRPFLPYVRSPGIIVDVKGGAGASLKLSTKAGSFTVKPFELQAGAPQQFLAGAVAVDRVPTVQMLSGPGAQNDFADLAAGSNGELWTAWVSYAGWKNKVVVRRFDGSKWGEEQVVSGTHDDIFVVKLAADNAGGVWCIWSAQVKGNFDLYGTRFANGSWSSIERLTAAPQPDIYHAVATDSKGNLWIAWQGFRRGRSNIFVRRYDGSVWSEEEQVSFSAANDWEPALAADRKGRVYVAWDTYDQGSYDVRLSRYEKGEWAEPEPLAATPKFEAHVNLACDNEDRLWAVWSESGSQWGKDTGFLVKRQGRQLYQERMMAVAVLEGNKWREPAAEIEPSLPEDLRDHNDIPTLTHDGRGRVWLLFRHRHAKVANVPYDAALHRAAWEIFATCYEGGRWSMPVAVPFSQGRTDMRYGVAAATDGSLYAAWPNDNRDFDQFLIKQVDIYAARIPAYPGTPSKPALRDRKLPEFHTYPIHPNEKQDVSRIRGYTINSGGKAYKIYRGDTHRHTEFSHDGHNDGSLLETYRYAIDSAALDYLMVSDHNASGGPDVEYVNWLLQQMCDVMMVPKSFTPLFGYERSLSYPNGHRNVVFARRGNPTLPIPPEERSGKTGAKALYEYLKKYDGIAISHTPATGMGTDWRDNDPEVEPLVEIFQGDRVSAEYEGAPKAAWSGNTTTQAGGFRPLGYVWNAWAKGYKLGVQASSDHLSTHYSYAMTIAEDFTRDGLLQAMKRRHSYGATDNIILDYRLQDGDREFLQGDIAEVNGSFRLWIKIIGTAAVRQVDIIKNNTFLHTRQATEDNVEFTFVDTDSERGQNNYYYVRVQQADGQIAWSSPIWVTVQ